MIFFFQAEDGIRDKLVTGVQTCALPISAPCRRRRRERAPRSWDGRLRAVIGSPRQLDEECGPVARTTRSHRDDAPVLLDDAVGDGKTQASAPAHLLRGEERIEDPLLQALG